MIYTAKELRERAEIADKYDGGAPIVDDTDQLRAHADLIERYELLKKHAEAMANAINDDYADAGLDSVNAFDAYRADFPEER